MFYVSVLEIRRLLTNFVFLAILQIVNYIIPLVTFPYLIRVLGVEKFGLLAFAVATVGYFQILTDYGFNLYATKEISVNKNNSAIVEEIFSSVLIIKFGLLIISFMFLILIILFFDRFKQNWIIFLLAFGAVIGQTLFPIWFFQGYEKMGYITILNALSKVLFTIFIFIAIKSNDDYWKVPLLNSIGFLISGFLAIATVFKNFGIKFKRIPFNLIKKHFIKSTSFFLSRVSVSIYTISNTFVLGLMTDNLSVGSYSLAERLYQAIQLIYYPLNQTLYPYMANTRNIRFFMFVFKILILVNTLIVVFFFFESEIIYKLIFGKVFKESIFVFKILLLTCLVVVPSMLLGYPFLAAIGYSDYANRSVIYGSIMHLTGLLIFIFSKSINPYSVALMVFITEFFVFAYRIHYFAKIIKSHVL